MAAEMTAETRTADIREGSLEAPTRHSIDWKRPAFYDEDRLHAELERVYDICHGCRRCVSLCHAFPTLFDLIDESETMEVDGVDKADYMKVVDHCYLCDLCYMTKCPYVPPHEWNVDFPHLMLRAKAVKHKKGGAYIKGGIKEARNSLRDKALTSTDMVGRLAGIPVVAETVNALNKSGLARKALHKTVGIHADAALPEFHSRGLRQRIAAKAKAAAKTNIASERAPEPAGPTRGKVALFATCYCNRNLPQVGEDLIAVLEHNGIAVTLPEEERCCGMPKLELGDLDAVERAMRVNVPRLARLAADGWDLLAPIPSCVLMFKQELPLLFPDDEEVKAVQQAFFDPFDYLMARHKAGKLKTDFRASLGKVAYHAPCHQRVQNIGLKTRDILALVPDTTIEVIERCSGHDGTYAVKSECHDISARLCRPVVDKVQAAAADHYISDCPMAAAHIQRGLGGESRGASRAESPYTLLRRAYGI